MEVANAERKSGTLPTAFKPRIPRHHQQSAWRKDNGSEDATKTAKFRGLLDSTRSFWAKRNDHPQLAGEKELSPRNTGSYGVVESIARRASANGYTQGVSKSLLGQAFRQRLSRDDDGIEKDEALRRTSSETRQYFSTKLETSQQEQALVHKLMAINKEIQRNTPLATALKKLPEKSRLSFLLLCHICFLLTVPGSEMSAKEVTAISLMHGHTISQTLFGIEHEDYRDKSFPCQHATSDKSTSNFLAAIHILSSSAMASVKFVLQVLPQAREDGWQVLKFMFGLVGNGFVDSKKGLLTNILNILGSFYISESQPIIKNAEFLHLLCCLCESKDTTLFQELVQKFLHSQTVIYDNQDVEANAHSLAMMVSQSPPTKQSWEVYAFGGAKHIPTFMREIEHLGRVVVAKELEELGVTEEGAMVIITTQQHDYLRDIVLSQLQAQVSSSDMSCTQSHALESSVYGHLSRESYEMVRKLKTTSHFNIVKDTLSPHLTTLCMQKVEERYRKNDHIWFRVSQLLRHEWYNSVKVSPYIPVHWVKVPQPNGDEAVEEPFKVHVSSPEQESSLKKPAELVLLNSQPVNVIEIMTSDLKPVTIPIQELNEMEDQGLIGCNYLMEANFAPSVLTFGCQPFDIKRDLQIGRELPLPPSKLETEKSVALSNIPQDFSQSHGGGPQGELLPASRTLRQGIKGSVPTSSFGRTYLKQTKPYVQASAVAEVTTLLVPEYEIRNQARNGFDRPGHCFYGDQMLFEMGKKYPLPDSLPSCRILREGGNGTVLEVNFSGEVYAVKKTTFRWREVLIMPKLHHKNVLKLVALIIGDPLEKSPRRRYVYHLYPRLSNDLGRRVGSFEKHCLRTLMERYREEPLLLKKIKSNFCHVARELLHALDYLHSRPLAIVHRDVKVSNVLVKMACDCPNPLVCVCRNQPDIVLSDFDASLELSKEGTLEPDPPQAQLSGFPRLPMNKVYHVSAVGTIGYKSPEGSMYTIGNDLETMPPLSTKADIFSYGILMALLFLNQEGPKHQKQMSQLLLSLNQTVTAEGQLSPRQKKVLMNNEIHKFRPVELVISQQEIEKILPTGRVKRDLTEQPSIINFLESALAIDPKHRWSARQLLSHPYLSS